MKPEEIQAIARKSCYEDDKSQYVGEINFLCIPIIDGAESAMKNRSRPWFNVYK